MKDELDHIFITDVKRTPIAIIDDMLLGVRRSEIFVHRKQRRVVKLVAGAGNITLVDGPERVRADLLGEKIDAIIATVMTQQQQVYLTRGGVVVAAVEPLKPEDIQPITRRHP